MPFQSEKQRRYLWANEPEIARDWTDTYGSRIRKDNGGIMQGGVQNFLGEQPMVNAPKYWQSAPDHEMTELAYITPKERDLLVDVDMYGTMRGGPNRGPSGIMSLNGWGSADEKQNVAGADISSGMDKDPGHKGWSTGVGANQTTQGTHGGWDTKQEHQKAQTQAFKDMGYKGAKLNRLVGGGPNIGNWASGFAGSKIGGGLGSMLFGPWGMLLGSLFGRGVGQRAYTASQTDEQETLKDILFGDNNILSSMFNKKKTPTPTSEGLGGIDLSDMRDKIYQEDPGAVGIENKFGDDYTYRPSEKMYWDEQQTSMPKNLDASISDLENWMSENPQLSQQKHINYLHALKVAQHNKALEEDPNRPGLHVNQLWE